MSAAASKPCNQQIYVLCKNIDSNIIMFAIKSNVKKGIFNLIPVTDFG